MANVFGALEDMGLENFRPYNPDLVFIPSGPAFTGQRMQASKPVVANITLSGFFSADLAPTTLMSPERFYRIRLRWPDATGGFIGMDFPDWELRVPPEGGAVGDLLALPPNPSQVWVGEDAPPTPIPGTWWMNPVTGDLFEWMV